MAVVTSAEVDANRPVRRARRAIRCLLALVLLVTVSAVFGLLSPASAADIISPLPDDRVAQITSDRQVRVSSILQVGDTIYLGGSFTEVGGKQHKKLAAIDAPSPPGSDPSDGTVIHTWDPQTNNQVLALAASPDGERIYAGGTFTSVNGANRNYLVALDADTGDIVPGWTAQVEQGPGDSGVYSLATLDSGTLGENDPADRLYVGGKFKSVNGDRRTRLAAVFVNTGEPDPGFTPTVRTIDSTTGKDVGGNVRTLALSPDKTHLYVGGNYNQIGEGYPPALPGESTSRGKRPNLASLDPDTGALDSWTPDPKTDNNYEVFDLAVTSNKVHVAGGGRNPDGTAESFRAAGTASEGASVWHIYSSGDFQAVALLDDELYFGGHFIRLYKDPWTSREVLANRNKFMAVPENWSPQTGEQPDPWNPKADMGVWAMTADPGAPNSTADGHIYAGGDFTQINAGSGWLPRRGFAQFSPK